MKRTRETLMWISPIYISIIALCFVLAFSVKAEDESADVAEERTLLAGVSSVLYTDKPIAADITSGVATIMNDFSPVQIEEVEISRVAEGYNEEVAETAEETGNEVAPEPAEAEYISDSTFCGYTNLGIAKVKDCNLNVREEASIESAVVGKMTRHNACEILGVEGEWTKITSGNVSGYVKSEYLITGEEALAIAMEEVQTYATVTTQTLRVRSEQSTESDIVSLVGDGEDLVVISETDEWAEVEVDDETGYVYKEYITLAQKLPTAKTITEVRYGQGVSDVRVDLVQYALQFVGNKYVWGGTSLKNGVDCSGFTMKIYEKYGVYLPHSSKSQPSYGTKISASEAQPGDLFFYGRGNTIGHVAIYIGNGQIVHASNKRDGIKISSCYYRTPICVVSYLD